MLMDFDRKPHIRGFGPSDAKDDEWLIYDSTFRCYLKDFYMADSKGYLPGFLKQLSMKDPPVVIDLMASTAALSSFYGNYGMFKPIRGLAVGFHDIRSNETRESDKERGISCLSGDLNKSLTWKGIRRWLGNRKADLIMERGYGGLQYIPTRLSYQRVVLAKLWDMLNPDGGTMVLQTPPEDILERRGTPVEKWLNLLDESAIENDFAPSFTSLDGNVRYGMLKLVRNPAVDTLPSL